MDTDADRLNSTGPYLDVTARDVALDRLRPLIERGYSDEFILEHLNTGSGGGCGPAYAGRPRYGYSHRGGYVPGARELGTIGRDKIGATSGAGALKSAGVFSIRALLAELRSGTSQPPLL